MGQTTDAISFREVSFSYGGPAVLEGVNLDLPRGQMVSIVGPNGGGKTTLLKLALGLLTPTRGTVTVLGTTPAQAQASIGYVPQHARHDLTFPVTALDVVMMGISDAGRFGRRRSALDIARQSLAQVEMESVADRLYGDLSGGQRQRVLLARALAVRPEMLLLDEPTANVDLVAQREIHRLLERLSQRLTVILVTHDMSFVSSTVGWTVCVNRRISVHPTQEVSVDLVCDLYGDHMRMVMHDRHVGTQGEPAGPHAHGPCIHPGHVHVAPHHPLGALRLPGSPGASVPAEFRPTSQEQGQSEPSPVRKGPDGEAGK